MSTWVIEECNNSKPSMQIMCFENIISLSCLTRILLFVIKNHIYIISPEIGY